MTLFLISGAAASPNFVVSWLYSMINDIKKHGLVVGIKANGKFAREAFDPDKKFEKDLSAKRDQLFFKFEYFIPRNSKYGHLGRSDPVRDGKPKNSAQRKGFRLKYEPRDDANLLQRSHFL